MAKLLNGPLRFLALDGNGNPVPGAKLYTYEPGTLTAKTSYTDSTLTTVASQPIVCDSGGRALVYLAGGGYRLRLTAADGATLLPDGDIETGTEVGSGWLTPQEYGAAGNGTTDDTNALKATIAAAASLRLPIRLVGQFRYTAQLVIPAKVSFIGAGALTSDESPSGRSISCLIKDFDGVGVLFSGDDCFTDCVQYDSAAGHTGDNVQVTGSRFRAPSIAVTNAGQDGLRIGASGATGTGVSTVNANLWKIGALIALGNDRHGLYVDDTNTGGSVTWPNGAPDCNAGSIAHAECDRNGGDGIAFGNTIDNYIGLVVAQSNTGYGVSFRAYARNNVISKCYTESNTAGDGMAHALASQNMVLAGSRAASLSSGWDNTGSGGNLIISHTSNIGGAYDVSPWHWGPSFYAVNPATGGTAFLGAYVDAQLAAYARIEKSATTGTKYTIATKRDGDSVTDKVSIDHLGRVFIHTPSAGVYMGSATTAPGLFSGSGTPESAVTAPIGSLFLRTDGGAGTSLYVKQTGTGNTGWVGK